MQLGLFAKTFRLYLALLGEADYSGALVLHGLDESDVPASVAFLRSAIAQAPAS